MTMNKEFVIRTRIALILCIILLNMVLFITSCKSYQVVQEVNVNMYHLHNPRTGDVQVIVTKDKLKVGEFYRLNDIDIIVVDANTK